MNKKGEEGGVGIVSYHTIGIIVAVFCTLLLIGYFIQLFVFRDDPSKDILKKVEGAVATINGPSYELDKVYFKVSASDGIVYLRGYGEGDFPEQECVNFYETCLCVCNSEECDKVKSCRGFEEEIRIGGTYEVLAEDIVVYTYSDPELITGYESLVCEYRYSKDTKKWSVTQYTLRNHCIDSEKLVELGLPEGVDELREFHGEVDISSGDGVESIHLNGIEELKLLKDEEGILWIGRSERYEE